ncbi:MAG: enoyl-CoA hydratase-related protein [Pseudomonadota bacterium]
MSLIDYQSDNRIALITINRADRLNALSEEVIVGLQEAWRRYRDSDDRCAIVHAAGERAFSVGADIGSPPKEMWQGVPSVGVELNKPIIAAVHGWCIGGAYCIVQMCDLVIAADNTRFKYPEAQLGFSGGLIASMMARVPQKVAMEFMLLGQDLSAQRAYEVGMVNKIVPAGTEVEAAREWATILANSAPLVVETLKKFTLDTLAKSPAEAAAIAREDLLTIRNSEDGKEGGRAFAEKRTPNFQGR